MAEAVKDDAPRNAVNGVLLGAVGVAAAALLWAASTAPLWAAVPIGIAFSFLLLTNYALMHEAAHHYLHGDARANRWLGMATSWWFPMSFTMFEITHDVHHRSNRTDHEMFDYYYPSDNRLIKYGQWYGILTGLYWFIIPLGSVIMAVAPGFFRMRAFKRSKSSGILFDDFDAAAVQRVRVDVLGGVVFWTALWYLLDLHWLPTLILYACFAFNWATRQYVTHAFSPRDVRNGAFNLKVGRLSGWIMLNGHWDLVHHQYPTVPWHRLPHYGRRSAAPESYWKHYWRLWKGPRPCPEPAPRPLARGYVFPIDQQAAGA